MNFDIFKNEQFQRGNHKLCSQIKYLVGSSNPVTSSSCIPKREAMKQVMGDKRTQIVNPKAPQQRKLPSLPPPSVCSTASTTSSSDAVHQYEKALNKYLDEARRRLAHTQPQTFPQSESVAALYFHIIRHGI
jgi:hypothetical protein